MASHNRVLNVGSHCLTTRVLQLRSNYFGVDRCEHELATGIATHCANFLKSDDQAQAYTLSCRLVLETIEAVQSLKLPVPKTLVSHNGCTDVPSESLRLHAILLDWVVVELPSVSRSPYAHTRLNQVLPGTRRVLFATQSLSALVVVVVGVGLSNKRATLLSETYQQAATISAVLSHLQFPRGTRVYYGIFTQSNPSVFHDSTPGNVALPFLELGTNVRNHSVLSSNEVNLIDDVVWAY